MISKRRSGDSAGDRQAGRPVRLMEGPHHLEHVHDLSDEEVVERLVGGKFVGPIP